jgi:cullin 3
VKAQFGNKRHELNVAQFQAFVLLLFNNNDTMTYEQIHGALGIPETELKRSLQSLACGKFKILLKERKSNHLILSCVAKSREVHTDDKFTFNPSFAAPQFRIKVPTIAISNSTSRLAETDQEQRQTRQKVEEARKHMIDAAIVRIMKSRKTMAHNTLVAEVTHQLVGRFAPDLVMIKRRVELLIDREYLTRDAADRKVYNYVA